LHSIAARFKAPACRFGVSLALAQQQARGVRSAAEALYTG
jgi:hypothetical protein